MLEEEAPAEGEKDEKPPPAENPSPGNPTPPPGFGNEVRDAIRWFLQADLLTTEGETPAATRAIIRGAIEWAKK